MKFSSIKKRLPIFSLYETILTIAFLLYIVFPVKTPTYLTPWIDSSLGIVAIFFITIYLFLYTNPIIGVLYVIVAYVLLQRTTSGKIFSHNEYHVIDNTPQIVNPNKNISNNILPVGNTLEEEMVSMRSPIMSEYVDSDFEPVADKLIQGASLL